MEEPPERQQLEKVPSGTSSACGGESQQEALSLLSSDRKGGLCADACSLKPPPALSVFDIPGNGTPEGEEEDVELLRQNSSGHNSRLRHRVVGKRSSEETLQQASAMGLNGGGGLVTISAVMHKQQEHSGGRGSSLIEVEAQTTVHHESGARHESTLFAATAEVPPQSATATGASCITWLPSSSSSPSRQRSFLRTHSYSDNTLTGNGVARSSSEQGGGSDHNEKDTIEMHRENAPQGRAMSCEKDAGGVCLHSSQSHRYERKTFPPPSSAEKALHAGASPSSSSSPSAVLGSLNPTPTIASTAATARPAADATVEAEQTRPPDRLLGQEEKHESQEEEEEDQEHVLADDDMQSSANEVHRPKSVRTFYGTSAVGVCESRPPSSNAALATVGGGAAVPVVGSGGSTTSSVVEGSLGYDRPMQEEFNLRFGLNEFVLQAYRCALSRRILLQGRMYISQNYLGFFSVFNDSTLFGGDTTVIFPLCNVTAMHKRQTAYIFDNSIEFGLADGSSYFFTSLVNRDKTFELVKSLCDIHRKMTEAGVGPTVASPVPHLRLQSFSLPDSIGTAAVLPQQTKTTGGASLTAVRESTKERETCCVDDSSSQQREPRTAQEPTEDRATTQEQLKQEQPPGLSAPSSIIECSAAPSCAGYEPAIYEAAYCTPVEARDEDWRPCPTKPLKHSEAGFVWSVEIGDLFAAAFDHFQITSNPYARILETHNATGYETPLPNWTPPPPSPFGSGTPGDPNRPRRELRYQMDFKQSGITRMLRFPSRGSVHESFVLYVLSSRCFVVESVMRLSGMPLVDCFSTRSRFKATALSDKRTQLDGEFELDFHKHTIMAGRIESETMSQLKENLANFLRWTSDALLQRMAAGRVGVCGVETTMSAAQAGGDGALVLPTGGDSCSAVSLRSGKAAALNTANSSASSSSSLSSSVQRSAEAQSGGPRGKMTNDTGREESWLQDALLKFVVCLATWIYNICRSFGTATTSLLSILLTGLCTNPAVVRFLALLLVVFALWRCISVERRLSELTEKLATLHAPEEAMR